MNSAWKHVIKPQAQKHAGLNNRTLGMLAEEKRLWQTIKTNTNVRNACLRAVKQEHDAFVVFEQKRLEVASALKDLCANDMKDVFCARCWGTWASLTTTNV